MIFNQPPKEVAGECVMSPAECKEHAAQCRRMAEGELKFEGASHPDRHGKNLGQARHRSRDQPE